MERQLIPNFGAIEKYDNDGKPFWVAINLKGKVVTNFSEGLPKGSFSTKEAAIAALKGK